MRFSSSCICLPQLHVESAERLVEEQRRRAVDERARQRDALLLAARELPRPAALEPFELDDARASRRCARGARRAARCFTFSPNATLS